MTLKVVSESRVTWATSVRILVFLGLSVLDLGPMYATDRCQTGTEINTDIHYTVKETQTVTEADRNPRWDYKTNSFKFNIHTSLQYV